MAINPGTAYFVKLHTNATIPKFGSRLAAGADLYLPNPVILRPREYELISLGIIAIPPEGWHFMIYLRSSAPVRYPGLTLMNHVGIIDSDYTGPNDEIKLALLNHSVDNTLRINAGERIAQMCLVEDVRPNIEEITYDQVAFRRSRGGFGSTG
jgi:dUTP pyrophosphatase